MAIKPAYGDFSSSGSEVIETELPVMQYHPLRASGTGLTVATGMLAMTTRNTLADMMVLAPWCPSHELAFNQFSVNVSAAAAGAAARVVIYECLADGTIGALFYEGEEITAAATGEKFSSVLGTPIIRPANVQFLFGAVFGGTATWRAINAQGMTPIDWQASSSGGRGVWEAAHTFANPAPNPGPSMSLASNHYPMVRAFIA